MSESFNDRILLKIRREFSGQEKYRLFLQQLDRLETELKRERELNTELMKKEFNFKELQDKLDEYDSSQIGRTCVKMKTYEKCLKQKKEWEDRYWELHHKVHGTTKTEHYMRKQFTLTEADIELLNSISEDREFAHIWKVLAEKHGFNVDTIEDFNESERTLTAEPNK